MEKSPMTAALERKPDAMKITQHYYRYLGSIMALLVRALYCFFVVVSFTVRRMVSPEKDSTSDSGVTFSGVVSPENMLLILSKKLRCCG